ncbi:DUF572-domain-containing protein [Meira miltonrushii]|uniref:Splicing factor YJU2 n=1 Tax=Meira miltonrushii TaxID=1280837 RepID=A0A316V5X6_9BASI|nr:DUF572-domain-containing protein [Meira miltonrushii]PWN32872.1 DUF572-domain-containing protein [Meira miltonrushii]
MAERKVLNKYIPPDFDPSKIPRLKKGKDRQEAIRLMAPFSMRCNTCGDYVYAGKKFNGRKETVQGEVYYGIKIFRFYIKCPTCSSEITFKTDPKNTDYTIEHGASRNFEPWRETKEGTNEKAEEEDPLSRIMREEGVEESDEDEDPMKALEKRQQEAKREMEIMDALQDIRTRNARIDRVDTDEILARHLQKGKEKETKQRTLDDEEDEALVRKYFGKDMAAAPALSQDNGKRPHDEKSEEEASPITGISVKRARTHLNGTDAGGEDNDEKEPEVLSLLSDANRNQLSSGSSKTASFASSVPGKSSIPTASAKRKKGSSIFGIVKKKT